MWAARSARRARIQARRSRGLSSVKGTACSTRAKYSSSSFSACARVAIGAPQFTDAIASSTTMKARAILDRGHACSAAPADTDRTTRS